MVWSLMLISQMNAYLGMSQAGDLWAWQSPDLRDTFLVISPADTFVIADLDTSLADAGTTRVLSILSVPDTVHVQMEEVSFDSSRDTLLLSFSGDTVFQDTVARRYVLPFNVGSVWRMYPFLPLSTPVPMDMDGDGDADTLTLFRDTVRVVASETLHTSLGPVRTFRVLTEVQYRMVFSADSQPPEEDSVKATYIQAEWWVPDTGKVRDSLDYTVLMWQADTLRRFHRIFVRELRFTTPVMEPSGMTASSGIRIRLLPGRLVFLFPQERTFLLLDPTGRLVRKGRAQEGTLRLAPGTYHLYLPEQRKAVKVVVP